MPAVTSLDCKPDGPECAALRARITSTLEEFSQFLSTPAAIELVSEVDDVLDVLREHGEKAGLLSPSLIRAMYRYLDAYKKAHGDLRWYLKQKEHWIWVLRRNLRLEDSKQVFTPSFCGSNVTNCDFLSHTETQYANHCGLRVHASASL